MQEIAYNQDTQKRVVWPSTASMDTQQTSMYFTGNKKMTFSHIHSSIILEQKQTIFAGDILLEWATSHSTFEMNPLSYHGNAHLQLC